METYQRQSRCADLDRGRRSRPPTLAERAAAPAYHRGVEPAERFSDRVADYVRYRPDYPSAAFEAIEQLVTERERELGQRLPRTAADVGAGTGIFTHGLLARDWAVHAIEPNARMRAAAEAWHGDDDAFTSHAAVAEATGLPDCSVALVVAAQAFHWFDSQRCREEWRRILVPGGLVCLVWNVRRLGLPFMDAYDQLLTELLPDYSGVVHRHADPGLLRQFYGDRFTTQTFPHRQILDWPSLLGRLASSSYAPLPGQPAYELVMTRLRVLFDQHQVDGSVAFPYSTMVCIGTLSS